MCNLLMGAIRQLFLEIQRYLQTFDEHLLIAFC